MHFAITIPTFNRTKKLTRCIESILNQTYQNFDIYVIADNNDEKTATYVKNKWKGNHKVHSLISGEHRYVAGCWNYFSKNHWDKIKDSMVWCVDDIEMYPNCLEELSKFYQYNFPNKDGVVGISQECPGHSEYTWKEYGQVVLGRAFIGQYPEHQVCAIPYHHFFQDEEMYQYATSINKFKLCKTAILKHFHPSFLGNEVDDTHLIPRGKIFKIDKGIFKDRQERGLIWGKSFET